MITLEFVLGFALGTLFGLAVVEITERVMRWRSRRIPEETF
jgi:hypothetical protein